MHMGRTAAVAGASGYAGGELLRLVLGHPGLSLGPVAAGAAAGRPVTELHPQLPQLASTTFGPTTADRLAEADIVFLALPHGESAALVADLPADLPVVDLGADFRLADAADWDTYYGGSHAGTWVYGLPELPGARERVAAASRVANPGCYPTSVALGLAPLLAAGLVEPSDVVVVAASGTSGAGRKTSASLMASEVMGALTRLQGRRDPPAHARDGAGAVRRRRVAGDPVLHPRPRPDAARHPRDEHRAARRGHGHRAARATRSRRPTRTSRSSTCCPRAPGRRRPPSPAATAPTCRSPPTPHAGRAVVVAAIDNLVKGAAGQAVQNANLVLGLDETAGLPAAGIAP